MSTLEFKLPDVGEGLAEGEIVRWHAAPGDRVEADVTLVDVETDKAIVAIPAPATGTLKSLGAAEGEVLAVGAVLATFEVDDDQIPTPAVAETKPEPAAPAPATPKRDGRVRASPAVRKAARELGVDLLTVQGSGSHGQITRADLDAATARALPSATAPDRRTSDSIVAADPGADRIEPLKGLRRRIAETMERAWREIPHIFHMEDIDASQLVAARQDLNQELGDDGLTLSYMPFLVKACVLALKAHPRFNASIDTERGEITYRHRYNIGIATATSDGLIVPVLRDADQRSLIEIAREITALAEAARARKATVQQLSQGTFTISNFGAYGSGTGMPIIRPPEVAIAGFGRIKDGLIVADGKPVVRPVLPVVVSTDHRLNDGAHLSDFVSTLAAHLREPVRLLGQR